MRNRNLIWIAMSCFVLMAACGIDNTMYNARKYFRMAQERPLNANGKPVSQSVADYTKTIQKCGVILTERKDSPDADDALFLMAKALYFKGNSAFQAKDQFDNLIKAFPNSPFVPEAYIYLAKVNREINKPKEAKTQLEEFIRNPKFRKDHPKALLTLADFEIQDKDFVRAQYWLEKIISEYPKTKEFAEAYFLFGKNYYLQKDYSKSLQQFRSLIDSRRVNKDLKMDANYYIALNLYYLKDYDTGSKVIKRLVNNEYRADRIAPARVLSAEYLLAMNEIKDAEQELDYIVKTYPRTASSAEAQYVKAQYQFYTKGQTTDAIASYNRVRSELGTSDFANIAQRKATALTQINQKLTLDSETNLQQFTDYQFLAADYFVDPLALPDSALVRYNIVLAQPQILSARLDSLSIANLQIDHDLDSLKTVKSTLAPASENNPDSTDIMALHTTTAIDTVGFETDNSDIVALHTTTAIDTVGFETDNSDIVELNTATEIDSLTSNSDIADSLQVDTAKLAANLDKDIAKLEIQKETIKNRMTNLETTLTRFQSELVPFCYFAQASIYKHKLANNAAVDSIYAMMQVQYPDDKYTISLRQMRNGEPLRLIDRMRERTEAKLDKALGYADTMPDSMVVLLNELTDDTTFGTDLKADFRLGWYYTFEAPDTLLAKEYFDKVLAISDSGDYGILIRRFYNGKRFLFSSTTTDIDSLAVLDTLAVDSLAVIDSLSVADSTATGETESLEPSTDFAPDESIVAPSDKPEPKDAIKQEELPNE